MRVLQLGLDWFPERAGGLTRYYSELMNAAGTSGLEMRGLVAGTSAAERDSSGQVTAFCEIGRPLPVRLWMARQAVVSALRSFKPDIIASHFALYTAPALDRIRLPLVVHFQGPWASEGAVEGSSSSITAARRIVECSVYRRATALICLSAAFRDLLVEEYGVDEAKVRVVPGAIDVERYSGSETRSEARRRLGLPLDRPIVGAIRRLVPRMGLENAIRAMEAVVRRYPDALLLIGGKGPLAGALTQLVDELDLSRNVRLLGFVPDVDLPTFYRAADVTLVPTAQLEGFGLIAAESLASGTPALVTPVGGLPEVVSGLSPDLVLRGTGAKEIAEGLLAVLSGDLQLPDAETCRAYVQPLSWQNVVPKIKAVYESAL